MKILIIGDIVGRPGRHAVKQLAPALRKELNFDFFIANAENAAGGKGITGNTVKEILNAGVDVITTGDHAFQQGDAAGALDIANVIRPLNYPPDVPGKGYVIADTPSGKKIAVVNLLGRVFMKPADCPFRAIENILDEIKNETNIIIVDFHAEATSEKIAMGWFLNGKVSAVCGTHTHVLTADNRILPEGTACITDLGMTGARDSVIGCEIKPILNHFLTGLPNKFKIAKENIWLTGAIIEVDDSTGKALSIDIIKKQLTNN